MPKNEIIAFLVGIIVGLFIGMVIVMITAKVVGDCYPKPKEQVAWIRYVS
jgi:uncharacterized membrane-anchored protein YhcB (DUF1043 family)